MVESNSKTKKTLLKKKKITTTKVIKYIEKPSGPVVTWIKFFAVMLAASLLLWQLIEKIQDYIDNPVVVTREINFLEEIPFPGLILCNKQPLRYSHVQSSPMRTVIDHFISMPGGENRMEDEARFAYYAGRANEVNVKDFYMNASQTAQDFIVGCVWQGGEREECGDTDFLKINTDHGPCFRLNLNQTTWPNLTAAGPADAFQVVLNIDTLDSYQASASKSTGAVVALFPYDNPTPLVAHIGFSVPLGFEVNIGIRSEFVERLSKKKKGQCDPEAKLILFDKYNTPGCILEHKFMRIANACECLPYNFPHHRSEIDHRNVTEYLEQFPQCNIQQQFACADKLWESTDAIDLKNFSCPDACYAHRYVPSFSYATLAGDRLKGGISKDKGDLIDTNYVRAINSKYNRSDWRGFPNDQHFRENFIILNIYFKELLHETIVQHLTYDGWGFAGDIAATVGIILGFLLSTLGEVVANCVWCLKKVRGEDVKDVSDVMEESSEDDEDEEEEDEDEDEEEEEKDKEKHKHKDKHKDEDKGKNNVQNKEKVENVDEEKNEDEVLRNRRNYQNNP